jgi:ankyrin repeat protein
MNRVFVPVLILILWKNTMGLTRILTIVCVLFLLVTTSTAACREDFLRVAKQGDIATVQALLAEGADLKAQDTFGATALMRAAEADDLAMVRALLEHGADIQAQDTFGQTALMAATTQGHTAVMRVLRTANAGEPAQAPRPRAVPPRAQIRRAQERLHAAGFDAGPPDGLLFGARTTEALSGYQHAHGLPVTGRLDDATRQAFDIE